MKTFALAATVVAGLLFTASSADAQYRRSSGYYSYPAYSYPSYSTPMYNGVYGAGVPSVYAPPSYNGVVSVGSYTPLGGTAMIVPSGGLQTYGSSSYYTPTYNNGYYNTTPYYNFNGSSVVPYGSTRYGRRW